jgi:GDSL-like Lipase/Acylhydrolase family
MARLAARLRGPGLLLLLLLVVAPVVLAAFAAPAAAQDRYTSLGDSFTSGPFIPNPTGKPLGCLRSDHNYPHLTAEALDLSLTDVSCGGATTDHMTKPQRTADGTNPPQLEGVKSDTNVVTLGIGGNDIGFSEIIDNCTAATPNGPTASGEQYCKDHYVQNGQDELANRIERTQPEVEAVLDAIRTKAPGARVYVVDYPAILPSTRVAPGSKVQCWPEMPVTYVDIPYLRKTQERLNAMLASAAASKGASFVATYPNSVDHNACVEPETNKTRYIEPMAPTRPAAPVHPNAAGEEYMSEVVRAAIGG